MPIKVTDNLPATEILNSENIFVMTETRAISQDIRSLEILILNLMPKKIETETQLLRVLGNTPLQINISFMHTKSYESKNTPKSHIETFYDTFDAYKNRKFDGLIITGAPVEQMPFEEVDYWDELCEIMEWSKTNVTSTFHICWGAQAGLYYHYGIPKYDMDEKVFGVFEHYVVPEKKHKILLRGFDDKFYVPHSRHTEVREGQFFVTGHSEYDDITLANEYFRDKSKGLDIKVPRNYFPNDEPTRKPPVVWRSHANLLYSNWLNYFVYQTTPYKLSDIT